MPTGPPAPPDRAAPRPARCCAGPPAPYLHGGRASPMPPSSPLPPDLDPTETVLRAIIGLLGALLIGLALFRLEQRDAPPVCGRDQTARFVGRVTGPAEAGKGRWVCEPAG